MPAKKNKVHASLAHALLAAQQQLQRIEKDGRNAHFKYDYASAESMIAECRAVLHEHGMLLTAGSVTVEPFSSNDQGECLIVRQNWSISLVGENVEGNTNSIERCWVAVPERGRGTDKALASSLTANLSYFLRDLLLLPRGDEPGTGLDDTRNEQNQQQSANSSSSGNRGRGTEAEQEAAHGVKKGMRMKHRASGRECEIFYVKGDKLGGKYGPNKEDVEWGWVREWDKLANQQQPPSEPPPMPPQPPRYDDDYDPNMF